VLIAVEGLGQRALEKAARAELDQVPRAERGGVSLWDASGIFGDLVVAGEDAGHPSARTLLLLYAADLAFRLRWEIRPALLKKRHVAAAPYVGTAIAFGRSAGIDDEWLANLFAFAPQPARTCTVARASAADRSGFVEFVSEQLAAGGTRRRDWRDRIRAALKRDAAKAPSGRSRPR
jgi:hypothetical protein